MAFSRKNFTMGADKYYFQIRNGQQNITIFRKEKEAAVQAYNQYLEVGKSCEWLGKWNGKSFVETSAPEVQK